MKFTSHEECSQYFQSAFLRERRRCQGLIEAGVNILHYIDNLDQATFSMEGLREQLRYALADCGVEPERISPK